MDESGPIEVVGVIDLERVQTKLDYVEREAAAAAAGAARLRQLRVPPAEDVEAAATMLRGVKYALQTSIQAMIDVAYHLAAKAFGSAPADAYEAFAVLARRGAIPAARLVPYRQMLGLRNRLVHGYQDIDDEQVLGFAEAARDFEQFRQEIQTFVRARQRQPRAGPPS